MRTGHNNATSFPIFVLNGLDGNVQRGGAVPDGLVLQGCEAKFLKSILAGYESTFGDGAPSAYIRVRD